MSGKAVAKRISKTFGTNDPETIAQREGLEVMAIPLPQRWWDILLWDFVAIRNDISLPWRRWCLAHCLGHHFMHHGNQLRLTERADLICARRLQEAQAESFAAWLLIPEEELKELKHAEGESLNTWRLAEHFNVPHEMIPFRLGLDNNPYLKSIGW